MRGTWRGVLLVGCLAVGCSDTPEPTAVRAEVPGEALLSRSGNDDRADGDGRSVRFDRLRGNQGPYVGAAGAIRGINAGGLPWTLKRGEARLDGDGELRVEVEGLVLQDRGTNPVAAFRAVLSCESFDDTGRTVVNVATRPVDTDEKGNARIRQRIRVPRPCYAPIVLVASSTPTGAGSWFAVSAF